MIDLLEGCQRLLSEAGCATTFVETRLGRALAFENATVLGFIVAYDDPGQLLERWRGDAKALLTDNQLGLRRAQEKAWNTYTVFLACTPATDSQLVSLGAVEEDLVGTRKIARAGIRSGEELRTALLPLLPIQNAPRLEAVDMTSEIQLRTTELPKPVVAAFLSLAQEPSIAQILEEEE